MLFKINLNISTHTSHHRLYPLCIHLKVHFYYFNDCFDLWVIVIFNSICYWLARRFRSVGKVNIISNGWPVITVHIRFNSFITYGYINELQKEVTNEWVVSAFGIIVIFSLFAFWSNFQLMEWRRCSVVISLTKQIPLITRELDSFFLRYLSFQTLNSPCSDSFDRKSDQKNTKHKQLHHKDSNPHRILHKQFHQIRQFKLIYDVLTNLTKTTTSAI